MRTERQLVVDDFLQRSGPSCSLVASCAVATAIVAGCFVYLMSPPPAETDSSELPSHAPRLVLHEKEVIPARTPPKEEEESIKEFQRAVDAILKRAANTSASAPLTFRPIDTKVPLPRRRPASIH
jgi:hypothetical protein